MQTLQQGTPNPSGHRFSKMSTMLTLSGATRLATASIYALQRGYTYGSLCLNLICNRMSLGSFRSNKIWFPAINDNRGKINCYFERRRPFFFLLLSISVRDMSVEVLHLGTMPSGLLSVPNPSSRPLTASLREPPFFTQPPSDTL